MDKEYFVIIDGQNPIIVSVNSKPNEPNCEQVLENWLDDNHKYKICYYWQVDTCERHHL